MRWGLILALLGAFVVQVGLVGWSVADRAMLLANGTEVRLAVEPVDPRDFFRGDYVVLGYAFSRTPRGEIAGGAALAAGDPVYAALEPGDEAWVVTAISADPPAFGTYLRGEVEDTARDDVVRIAYGLERFFVPEGTGREIEAMRNEQRVSVDVAVGPDGRAGLKRLLVDGEVRFEEPLY